MLIWIIKGIYVTFKFTIDINLCHEIFWRSLQVV